LSAAAFAALWFNPNENAGFVFAGATGWRPENGDVVGATVDSGSGLDPPSFHQ
jgi:hypothetical protein